MSRECGLVQRARIGLRGVLARLGTPRLLLLGYASYVLFGWFLLRLPISQATGTTALDDLFISTSAVSTTGLATVNPAEAYSFFGQLVIASLIQIGGLGYMTLGSFVLIAVSGRLKPSRQRVSVAALSLPAGFEVKAFLKVIVIYTALVEVVGAAALLPSFIAHGAPNPVWQAVFHSISAFCTAGFGLFSNSFEGYRDDVWLNIVIMVSSYLGAIGFIVIADLWKSVRERKAALTLTSKIILVSTIWISVVGTILFFLDEPTVREMPTGERWMVSLFQVMTASTTVGFNTIPIGAISTGSLFLLTIVMVIGASPCGTGGGIKTTTVTALWSVMTSVIRRRARPEFFGCEIPDERLFAAMGGLMFYLVTLCAGTYLAALMDSHNLADLMFECASALGTVGLSRGITTDLSLGAELVVIVLMFLGRLGPIAFGVALIGRRRAWSERLTTEDVSL